MTTEPKIPTATLEKARSIGVYLAAIHCPKTMPLAIEDTRCLVSECAAEVFAAAFKSSEAVSLWEALLGVAIHAQGLVLHPNEISHAHKLGSWTVSVARRLCKEQSEIAETGQTPPNHFSNEQRDQFLRGAFIATEHSAPSRALLGLAINEFALKLHPNRNDPENEEALRAIDMWQATLQDYAQKWLERQQQMRQNQPNQSRPQHTRFTPQELTTMEASAGPKLLEFRSHLAEFIRNHNQALPQTLTMPLSLPQSPPPRNSPPP